MAGVDLSLSGLASGFDWKSLVEKLVEVERVPQQRLRAEQDVLEQRNNAYGSIKTELTVLQSRVTTLQEGDVFDGRTATTSDSTIATATAGSGTANGTYLFEILQLATASKRLGTTNVGSPLSASGDVSGLVLSEAGFATAITAGTFTVNGQQITVATTDTLQDVFDNIAAATGNAVTASYDPGTDKITLSSSGEILLGSATDTSNFLQVAKLYNNGTGSVTSAGALGGVRLNAALEASNLATAISDGGSGAGEFKINGVSISFDASTDTLADILARINSSSAGVTASYDATQDRFVLTNKVTGDMNIALEDVTGNFLAATGLSAGTLSRGQNLLYTLNGGDTLVSQSNTIDEVSSGVTGLSVTALDTGTVTVSVATDTATIKSAITGFIDAYNRVQSLIDTETASSTDADGVVTAGVLAADGDAEEIARTLRRLVYSQVSGLSGVLDHLADLGITTSGDNDQLTLSDEDALDAALSDHLESVKELFSDATSGIATTLADYLERTIGEDGTLVAKQDGLTKQASEIDTQIADLERIVQANRQRMLDQFAAMEAAQQKLNQQLQFLLQQNFSIST